MIRSTIHWSIRKRQQPKEFLYAQEMDNNAFDCSMYMCMRIALLTYNSVPYYDKIGKCLSHVILTFMNSFFSLKSVWSKFVGRRKRGLCYSVISLVIEIVKEERLCSYKIKFIKYWIAAWNEIAKWNSNYFYFLIAFVFHFFSIK